MRQLQNISLVFLTVLLWQEALPQSTLAIDLPTVLRIAGAENFTIKEYEAKQALAAADRTKAREWWIPELQLGASLHQLSGSAMNGDGRFFTNVDRQNFNGGAGLNLDWDLGKGPIMAKAANTRSEAMAQLSIAERNAALLETIETYYDLIAAGRERMAHAMLVQHADTVVRQMEVLVNAGSGYTSDLLLAKSNLGHLRIAMLQAEAMEAQHAAQLTRLLALDPLVQLVVNDSILVPIDIIDQVTLDQQGPSLFAKRPDVNASRLSLLAAEQDRKTTTTGLLLPSLRIGSSASYFGDVFSPLYPTGEVNGALMWRIPISRLTSGGDLKQANARIALRENELLRKQALATEDVQRAKAQLRIIKEQLAIANASADLAAEAFTQTRQRQSIGTVRPFEVLQAQEVYLNAQLDRIRAIVAHNKAQYRCKVAVGEIL